MIPGENAVQRWNDPALPHDSGELAAERRATETQADIPGTEDLRSSDNDGIPSVAGA